MTLPVPADQNAQMRCRAEDCVTPRQTHGNGYCQQHFLAFCRRAGSIRREGFDQGLADLLAAAGFEVVGWWPVVDAAK